MIEYKNISNYLNHIQRKSWKTLCKIGVFCIIMGYIIFLLKELIVGIISIILFIIGIYFLYLSYNIWKNNHLI